MKLTIGKEQLINGLQTVQNIVTSRTSLPVLSNVLLRAEEGHLDLVATDLDVSISCRVEAKVSEPGSTTVPVKRIFGIVRELPAPEIDLEVDEKNVTLIQSGSSYYKINGLGAEEFPPIQPVVETRKLSLAQEKVRTMLRRTSFAISNDEARFVLNGLFFSVKEHKVTVVATDGRRLALAEEELETAVTEPGEIIIPAKAINELNRLLVAEGQMEIKFNANQVSFTIVGEKNSSIQMISKLIEGNYPNYRQVIPAELKERVPLAREEFLMAVHRAEFMTSDKNRAVKLTFTKNNLAITANSAEVGEGRESLAVNYKGKDIAVAFNPLFLMDPLKAIADDEVFLEITDELSPAVIKVNGPYLYVIMPMRTN